MIQRIQTLYLFFAAVVTAGIFYFDIYQATVMENGIKALKSMTFSDNYVGIILTVISIALSLVAIFLFKKRKRQAGLTWLNLLVTIGLFYWMYRSIELFRGSLTEVISSRYWIGAFLPVLSFVLLCMALYRIRKDEKLIRSLDRLR
ncbi:DUF4293 domain-containing protein [Compostibacter hankyongensis]|uniref:DUF4293 domain-containing protein n=1 Tax=Compostibacter hankyongensis TaxID=1007089 RepID=A0ABP8FHP0_9BACT